MSRLSRRKFLHECGMAAAGMALAACQPRTVIVEKEAPVEVTKIVKETVVVEKEVEKVVEKVVTVTPVLAEPIELRWHARGADSPEFTAAKQLEDTYSHLTLVDEPIVGGETQYYSKLLAMHATDTIGDVFWTSNGLMQHQWLVAHDVVKTLDELVAADNYDLSVFYSHAIDGCRHEGKLYAVPFLVHPGGGSLVIFNLDLFAEAGIEPPTEDWKLSDLVQISKALTKEDQWGFAGGEPGGAQHFLFYQQLAHSFGSDLLSEDGRTCIIDDDKNMETLWWIYDLFNKHTSSPKPSEIPEGHWAAFSSGYVAMFRTGYWGINLEKDVPESDTPFEVGALQMPWGPAQSRGALYQIDYDCMSAKTKHPEMAWEFLKLAVTHEAGMAIGWCCGARASVWSHPDKMQYAIHRAGRSAMEEAVLLRMPTNFRGQEIEEAMGQNMFAIYEGEKAPNEHVDTLKEIVQEILDKPMT